MFGDILNEDVIRDTEYNGYKLRTVNPYGFWVVKGIDGCFTSEGEAKKAIDSIVSAKEKKPSTKKAAAA